MIIRIMRLWELAGRVSPALFLFAAFTACCQEAHPTGPLVVRGLGTGPVTLNGAWSFHTGDDPAWASPGFDDSGWHSISMGKPWGDQGYWAYSGYAWYRQRIDFGDAEKVSIYMPLVDSVYELYWNGVRIGGFGPTPGRPGERVVPPAIYQLSKPGSGVMAFRVWVRPPDSSSAGDDGGLDAAPIAANSEAAANLLQLGHYAAIRSRLAGFSLIPFYAGLAILGALVWLRNRGQKLIFWMALYCFSLDLYLVLSFIVLSPEVSGQTIFHSSPLFFAAPSHALADVALWYMLIYLLNLDRRKALLRLARILAVTSLAAAFADDLLFSITWSSFHPRQFQILDAIATAGFSIPELFPLILVGLALGRGRLGPSRWPVAIAAAACEMYYVVDHAALEGQRFTRWTLAQKMGSPAFTLYGVPVHTETLLSTALIVIILFAVYRYILVEAQRQRVLREELKSAQELQRVLIPEALPRLEGFAITSAYQPAAEVGGDFFQLVAVDEETALLVLGDVSGKGLKAAMTVSLIIGALRALVDTTSEPGEILEMLNRRLLGRLQHGFVTCLVLRVNASGACVVASAGHPAPFVDSVEMKLPPALPLGLDPNAKYRSQSFDLPVGARLTVYTDGLLEARNREGEIFSFERLEELISQRPEAQRAVETAVEFGQEDDITVLTVTRLEVGQRASTSLVAPELEPARALG